MPRSATRIRRRDDRLWAMLFLAPNFVGFLVFVAFPVGFSLFMAFTSWDMLGREPFQFVGLRNFQDLLFGIESKAFWKYFANTLYLMIGLPIGIAGSLFLAVLLNEPIHFGVRWLRPLFILLALAGTAAGVALCAANGQATVGLALAILSGCALLGLVFARIGFRTLFCLPFFTAGVAMFILWKNLLNKDQGPINGVIRNFEDTLRWMGRGTSQTQANLATAAALAIGAVLLALWVSRRARGLANAGHAWPLLRTCVRAVPAALGLGLIAYGLHSIPDLAGLTWTTPSWLDSPDNLLGLHPDTVIPRSWADAKAYFGLGARDGLVLMGVWLSVGGNNMLLYLAGLSNVPQELYEASMIDGAGAWAKFRHVSWPQLAPTTFFIVIMGVIGGLQGGFEQARVMVERRAAESAVTLGYYVYLTGFEDFHMGMASAIAWVMFVMILVITLINWRFGSRQINA